MKNHRSWISSIVALSLVGGLPVAAETSASKAQKPRVMVLGTFHFQGSTSDGISVTMGDVLAPERQAEIEEVVERLAKFLPTKIMVEAVPEREGELNATYRSYLAGEHELTASESQQIAMRLAKNLGHERIYAVDHKQEMDFGRVMAAGQTAGQEELLTWFQATMAEIQQKLERAQGPDRTILEALRLHNGDWSLASDGLYLQLALLGTTENPAGAEEVGAWYQRNLKIYANIARQIESPDDRVLMVFGSGHLAHLASFFDRNPAYEWVSALEVLGEPD